MVLFLILLGFLAFVMVVASVVTLVRGDRGGIREVIGYDTRRPLP